METASELARKGARRIIVDQDCRSKLLALDWKVQRHMEQRELVALGKLAATKLTEEEYTAVIAERQRLRDLVS